MRCQKVDSIFLYDIAALTDCQYTALARPRVSAVVLTSSVTLSLSAFPDHTKRAAAAAASHCQARTSILHLTSTPVSSLPASPAAKLNFYKLSLVFNQYRQYFILSLIKGILHSWKQSSNSQFQSL